MKKKKTRLEQKLAALEGKNIKAGGYPLPEDWSPRGEVPRAKIHTSGFGVANVQFFTLPYLVIEQDLHSAIPSRADIIGPCRCPFSLTREPEKDCPDCGGWVSLT